MQKLPRIVILRTGNMKFYKGIKPDAEKQFRDELRFGGDYVAQHHTGGEAYNFAPWYGSEEERLCLGFVETMSSGSKRRRILVENILGCDDLRPSDPAAEDVLVVWCARIEEASESVRVMGWYHHATVYREYQEYSFTDENGELMTGTRQAPAVTKEQLEQGVYVLYTAGKNGEVRDFVRRAEIVPGAECDGYIEVLGGVSSFDKIVVGSDRDIADGEVVVEK